MARVTITPPVVQLAIDVTTIGEALRVAEAGVRAGVDWLEIGTPLVTFAGTAAVSTIAEAFPGMPILVDYKCMDGARKYALETGARGGRLCTVCAQAADATVKAMVEAGREAEVAIVCDLINAPDVAGRAAEVEALDVDSVYVHWGADQKAFDPARDPQQDLRGVAERVRVPVGIATFSVADGVRAIRGGAGIAVVGFPLIGQRDVEEALKQYVGEVKAAWRG